MVTIMSFANGLCSFLGSPKGLPYRLVYAHENLIVFCGTPRVSLRLGHAHVLTVHRTVIHYARAASLRRPLQDITTSIFYFLLEQSKNV